MWKPDASVMEPVNTQESKAQVISDLIRFSMDNIKDDLSNLNAKYPQSGTESNYRTLSMYYAQNGYTELPKFELV